MLDVELLNTSITLVIPDTSPLAIDAPTFRIAGEFVRVERIAALGGKRYRLSRLNRSVSSSLLKAPAHAAGAQIVFMDTRSALTISEAYYRVGQTLDLEAQGLGDAAPVFTSILAEGQAITPLAPVHGRAIKDAGGNVDLYWKRRSRMDLGWVDGVDQAQAEDGEGYRVGLSETDILLREWIVSENSLRISTSDLASFGVPQNSALSFRVQQIGRFAQSGPLSFGLS